MNGSSEISQGKNDVGGIQNCNIPTVSKRWMLWISETVGGSPMKEGRSFGYEEQHSSSADLEFPSEPEASR